MFGKHIGIDLGTVNVLVHVKGRGIVMNEPSVVAIRLRDNTMVAVGHEAYDMLGRTPESIEVARPIRDGVIADFVVTEAMLQEISGTGGVLILAIALNMLHLVKIKLANLLPSLPVAVLLVWLGWL